MATAQPDDSQSFRSVMERLGYEVVEGQLKDSVTARGVHIALRREFVTAGSGARARAGLTFIHFRNSRQGIAVNSRSNQSPDPSIMTAAGPPTPR